MKTKVLITIENGIIQHISTNSEEIQIVIIDYDKQSDEKLLMQAYIPDTRFKNNSHTFYQDMDFSSIEEKAIQMYLKSIDF